MNQSLKRQPGTQVKSQPVQQHHPNNLKEYLNIFSSNLLPIFVIFLSGAIITILYVINAVDIYKTTTSLKIVRPQGSILSAQLIPEFQDFQTDRYISNEIEILKSYTIREKVAEALLDSFKVHSNKKEFYYLVNRNPDIKDNIVSLQNLTNTLGLIVSINQKRGLDIAEIEVQSPSSLETQLIANVYAETYLKYSVDFARRELTTMKNFLQEEKGKKIEEKFPG